MYTLYIHTVYILHVYTICIYTVYTVCIYTVYTVCIYTVYTVSIYTVYTVCIYTACIYCMHIYSIYCMHIYCMYVYYMELCGAGTEHKTRLLRLEESTYQNSTLMAIATYIPPVFLKYGHFNKLYTSHNILLIQN